jgi:hypothetical protein
MEQKKVIVSIVILLLSLSVLLSVTSMVAADAALVINYNSVPYPQVLIPGDTILITFAVTNTEKTALMTITEDTQDFMVDPEDGTLTVPEGSVYIQREITAKIKKLWIESPHENITTNACYDNIGEIAPLGSFTISFQVRAVENITEGIYFLKVHVEVEGGSDVNFPIPVEISKETVDMYITEVPSRISLSGTTSISFSLVNKFSCPLQNVVVNITGCEDIDYSPESLFLGIVESRGSRPIVFDLKPKTIGEKHLTVSFEYMISNNVYKKHISITTEVIPLSDIDIIYIDMPTEVYPGDVTDISLEIYNAKTTPITGVTVVPVIPEHVFPSKYFIGEMNPDDVYSAHFSLRLKNMKKGEHTIGFKVIFKQGNDFYETYPVYMNYTLLQDASPVIHSSISPLPSILIWLPVIGGGGAIVCYFLYSKGVLSRWFKKKSTQRM